MPRPVLLAQLSDLHLGATQEEADPAARLETVVEAVLALPNPIDAVLVSGDLSGDGSVGSYRVARTLLDRFPCPVHVLPGNHDDRARLRETFALPGDGADPINYSVDVGELRLVALDSNVPGRDPGAFPPGTLAWLDEELGKDPERPAMLAVHHTPLATGLPGWDAINLTPDQRLPAGSARLRLRGRRRQDGRAAGLRPLRPQRRRPLLAGRNAAPALTLAQLRAGSGVRCSWTSRTTAAPSPTAIAQRLIEPERTSPAA